MLGCCDVGELGCCCDSGGCWQALCACTWRAHHVLRLVLRFVHGQGQKRREGIRCRHPSFRPTTAGLACVLSGHLTKWNIHCARSISVAITGRYIHGSYAHAYCNIACHTMARVIVRVLVIALSHAPSSSVSGGSAWCHGCDLAS